jgi:hypothetical protein
MSRKWSASRIRFFFDVPARGFFKGKQRTVAQPQDPYKYPTIWVFVRVFLCVRRVVQLVEHVSPKHGIAGSSPASPAYELYILEKQGMGILAKRCARVLRVLLTILLKENYEK